MMNVFESNAAELEKLRERVDETFRRRNESPEHTAAWQEAVHYPDRLIQTPRSS
jgi:hypothetical protein